MNIGREDKLPWMKWSWADWNKETGLRLASLAAKGLWVEMLSIMATSTKKGYLLIGEKQMSSKNLAKLTHTPENEILSLLDELRSLGIFSEAPDGTIYNRRMVRESELSSIRAECGKLGGQAKSKGISKTIAGRVSKTLAPSVSASASISNSSSKDKPANPIDIELTDLLITRIRYNDLKAKVPSKDTILYGKWVNEIRLCREEDERTEEEIATAILFSQTDNFWKTNILSAEKLRKKMQQLLLKASVAGKEKGWAMVGKSKEKKATSPETQANIEKLRANLSAKVGEE
jgi:hypothetical protein